jgi:hypothetical protein
MMPDLATPADRGTVDPVGAEISDDELAAEALAADPDAPIAADAVPFGRPLVDDPDALLPAWYMPPAVGHARRRHRLVIGGLIAALIVVNGAGLCVCYGFPQIAW